MSRNYDDSAPCTDGFRVYVNNSDVKASADDLTFAGMAFLNHDVFRGWVKLFIMVVTVVALMVDAAIVEARQRDRRSTASSRKSASVGSRSKAASQRSLQATVRGRGNSRRGKSVSARSARRKRVRHSRRARPIPISKLTPIRDSALAQGVVYREYRTNGRTPVVVHALILDRTIPGNALRLIKGEDNCSGLERLAEMSQRFSMSTRHTVYGVVNGNFWRAVRNTLIGPCVIDGEVVEMNSYKKWSSAFFDVKNAMVIDTFAITGRVNIGGRWQTISAVNHRDDQGVIVYNAFGGNTVPYVSPKQVERAYQEAIKDSVFVAEDSTEAALTQDVLRQEIARARRERDAEYPMLKIRVRYLRSPSVNVPLPCEVLSVDTGTVTMPIRGAVISLPRAVLNGSPLPRMGDTIRLQYSTNIQPQTPFMNAVCGTPRLVRNGVAKHEALLEGSTGARFINHALARCAIGSDSSGGKLILAAVPADRTDRGTVGASLQQMSQIMQLLGCREALNLDGGGSAGMMVGADHVFFDGVDPLTRRVGLGIGFVKLSKILRGGAR